MRREVALTAAAVFFVAICISVMKLYAQEAIPVTVPVSNTVVVPYGDWLTTIADYLVPILTGIILWAFRFLPTQIYAFAMTLRVEQLLSKAVAYGINSVAGANKDQKLNIQISNAVLREAIAYALLHGGPLVKKFMGSPTDVAEKIWARLELAPEVEKPNLAKVALVTAGDVAVIAPERKRQAEDIPPTA